MSLQLQRTLPASHLGALIDALKHRGYDIVGPTLHDDVIVYDKIQSVNDLPAGWTDEQQPGRYRTKRRNNGAWFDYAVGPHSWKRFLHPPEVCLWSAQRLEGAFRILPQQHRPERKLAFLGVRSCDWAAIQILDRVLAESTDPDLIYTARRDDLFIVGVQCTSAAATCFCASLKTGPSLRKGTDLALTELAGDGQPHRFLVEVGSERGDELLSGLDTLPATDEDRQYAAKFQARATQQGRRVDASTIRETLLHNFDHPRWDQVAERCLSCANCTMVCPTCFCTTVEDSTDVTGDLAERWRRWDSCFTLGFSYIHGGSVRASSRSRYRQWMTHKLACWVDQFGTLGCVGCGRCITWCPVGIDITEEARVLEESKNHGNP
ncbi:MAG TPA: 4Fe-4S dicluster domain-containing protein [Terriglobales bacterium]|nr:4Fe-4S dicluster domain-containing protein [Terriglobales bacterium]